MGMWVIVLLVASLSVVYTADARRAIVVVTIWVIFITWFSYAETHSTWELLILLPICNPRPAQSVFILNFWTFSRYIHKFLWQKSVDALPAVRYLIGEGYNGKYPTTKASGEI